MCRRTQPVLLSGPVLAVLILSWSNEAFRAQAVRVKQANGQPSIVDSVMNLAQPSIVDSEMHLVPVVSEDNVLDDVNTTTTTDEPVQTTTTTEDLTPAPDELVQLALSAHNQLREMHDAKPLTWCEECYREAKRQANQCQAAKKLFYGNMGENHDQGQNLYFVGEKRPANDADAINNAIDSWYEQVHYPGYDFTKNYLQRGTQQFVQIVWKETKSVGMAFSDDGKFVVANYFPASGQLRKFTENVSPNPLDSTTTSTTTTPPEYKPIVVKAYRWSPKLRGQFLGCRNEALIREARLALARNGKLKTKDNVVTTTKTKVDGKTTLEVKIVTPKGTTTETLPCQQEIFSSIAPARK